MNPIKNISGLSDSNDPFYEIKIAFESLAELLFNMPRTIINIKSFVFEPNKDALAFLINFFWHDIQGKEKLEKLQKQIKEIKSSSSFEDARIDISWIINRNVSEAYDKTLKEELKKAKDGSEKNRLNSLLELKKSFEILHITMNKSRKIVSFGGIDHTLLPLWYVKNYITKEALFKQTLDNHSAFTFSET